MPDNLFRGMPTSARIVRGHRLCCFLRVRAEIFLVHDVILVDDERQHA